ncbi:MAG: hypothetical protein Kow0098_22340 [Ignavibacteriaceae bacterium]
MTITIFGSSSPKPGEQQYEDAYRLGKLLAKSGFNICSGGYQGIMDAVSKAAREENREAIGVLVKNWGAVPSSFLSKQIICDNLTVRIEKLISLADGFVVLRGGTGTLLELSFVWEYLNKGILKNKPVVCHSDMWERIILIMNRQLAAEGRRTDLLLHYQSIEEIVSYLIMRLS